MAPIFPRPLPIDTEWAQSLVGLKMSVPTSWWQGCDGDDLNQGTIAAVDFTQSNQRYFQLLLGDDKDDANEDGDLRGLYYPMRYDAVFLYSNDKQTQRFRLLRRQVPTPDGEHVRVRRHQVRRAPRDRDDDDTASTADMSASSDIDDTSGKDDAPVVHNVYRRTDPSNWVMLKNGARGRTIDPIPYTGEREDFTVKITQDKVKELMDEHGDIRFHKVLEWTLPRFGDEEDEILWDWQAVRMRNYMTYIMEHKDYKPKYYNPSKNIVITGDHICRFYGVCIGRMLSGNGSIADVWSTRDPFSAVGPIKESMPQDAFKDLCRCMHFVDDWEDDDERWNKVYADRKEDIVEGTARHRRKFGTLEGGYTNRWQAMVIFGLEVTADESRVAGWYHSPLMVGPEPKPICTGATFHSLCVTKGRLATYKLWVRAYGGKSDEDLDGANKHTETTQKWVNLYDIMLEPFKGAGRKVTMDSAYMGDIMALIGRKEWLINMVGTTNENRTGTDAKEEKKRMKKCNYESIFFQHKNEPLVYAMW